MAPVPRQPAVLVQVRKGGPPTQIRKRGSAVAILCKPEGTKVVVGNMVAASDCPEKALYGQMSPVNLLDMEYAQRAKQPLSLPTPRPACWEPWELLAVLTLGF